MMRIPTVATIFTLAWSAALFSQDDLAMEPPFCGAVRTWNILGAYDIEAETVPSEEAMRRDYMTDGEDTELDFFWQPEATINTDFDGEAASKEIAGGPKDRNPGGEPTVFRYESPTGQVDFNDVFGGDKNTLDFVMAYAQVYVIVEAEKRIFLGVSSDDSIQVIVNREEVFIQTAVRAGAVPCEVAFPQDSPRRRVDLQPGINSVIVKVFDGVLDWNFALRFQDEYRQPVTEGLSTSLEPPPPPPASLFRRGDADGSGALKITDGIFLLSFLFSGSAAPPCADAADADDNGVLNITDGVYILQFLFAGGAEPAAPFAACGADPTVDELSCDRFPCA